MVLIIRHLTEVTISSVYVPNMEKVKPYNLI